MAGGKIKTREQIVKEIKECFGNKFTLLGDYEGREIKTKFHCNLCNNDFEMSVKNLFNNKKRERCPKCPSKPKVTKDIFEKRLIDIHNHNFVLKEEYLGYYEQTTFKCNLCGEDFKSTPKNLIDHKNKVGCPNCYGHRRNFYNIVDEKEFLKRLEEKYPNEYEMLDEYINYTTPIRFKHLSCGNDNYITSPEKIIEKVGEPKCNKCANNSTLSFSYVKKMIEKDKLIDLKVLSEAKDYKNNKSKLHVRRIRCGHEFYVRYNDITNGIVLCPICNPKSIQELIIKEFLEDNNIEFETEKTFSTCKYRKPLRFDFYIPEYNLLIEYDGIQHFEPTRGQNELKLTQLRDKIKNDWIKSNKNINNISLIRINYKQNIQKVLNDIFILNEIDDETFFINNYLE